MTGRTLEEQRRRELAYRESDAFQSRLLCQYLCEKIDRWWPIAGSFEESGRGLSPEILAAANALSLARAHEVVDKLRTLGLASRATTIEALRRDGAWLLKRYPDLRLARPEPGRPRGLEILDPDSVDVIDPQTLKDLVSDVMSGRLHPSNIGLIPRRILIALLAELLSQKESAERPIDLKVEGDGDPAKKWFSSLECQSIIAAIQQHLGQLPSLNISM